MTVSDAKLVLSELIDKYYTDSLLVVYSQALLMADATIQLSISSIRKLQMLSDNKDKEIKNLNALISNRDTEIQYLNETIIIQYVEIRKQKFWKHVELGIIGLLTIILIL